MAFHVVIPARFASTRLPGKPLLDIGGRPMIQRVWSAHAQAAPTKCWSRPTIERIAAAVSDPRGRGAAIAMMTDPDLPSGTDRVAAVAAARGWSDDTIVVNVQGDEPFLPPRLDRPGRGAARGRSGGGHCDACGADRVARAVPGPERGEGRHCGRRRRALFQPRADSVDARRSAGRLREPAGLRRGDAARRDLRVPCRARSASMTRWPPIESRAAREARAAARAAERRAHRRWQPASRRRARASIRPWISSARACAPLKAEESDGPGADERVRRHADAVEARRISRRGAVRRTLVRADGVLAPARPPRSADRVLADEHFGQPAAAVVLHRSARTTRSGSCRTCSRRASPVTTCTSTSRTRSRCASRPTAERRCARRRAAACANAG